MRIDAPEYPDEPLYRWRIGGVRAFAHGLDHVQTTWFSYLADDDEYMPIHDEYLERAGGAADVVVGSYVLIEAEMPVGGVATEVAGIAVLATGLTDAHVHLGRPAKVTAVNGSELTLEVTTRRGVQTLTATIGANTLISEVAAATNADVTAGNTVVVDLGREATAAKSVLIIK
jgi:hypothetical protein